MKVHSGFSLNTPGVAVQEADNILTRHHYLPFVMEASTKEQMPPQEKELATRDESSVEISKGSPAETIEEDEDHFMSGAKLHLLILGLSLACFLMALDMAIITVAIPEITEKFQSTQDIGWYVSAYLLTLCSLQPLSGKLYSNFSLKVGICPTSICLGLTRSSGPSWSFSFFLRSVRLYQVQLPRLPCSLSGVPLPAWAPLA